MPENVRFRLSLTLVWLFLAVHSPFLRADDNPCLTRTIVVTAIDAQGNPVKNLQASDLAGKLHGQPVQVLSAELTRRRPRIMVVVDMSGSMVDPNDRLWPITRMMLEDVVRLDSAEGQIGLAHFGTDVFKLVGLSPDRYAVHKEVAALLRANAESVSPMPERKTALWDALNGRSVQTIRWRRCNLYPH